MKTLNTTNATPAIARDGLEIGAYRAYDTVTERTSWVVDDPAAAKELADRQNAECAAVGRVGSAIVVRRGATGHCETLDGHTVWPPHGRGRGPVLFDDCPPDRVVEDEEAAAAAYEANFVAWLSGGLPDWDGES